MIKERTLQDIRTSQLAGNISHINNRFGYHNVGLIMGMTGMQYSGSYGDNFFGTNITRYAPVDKDMNVSFSVVHIAL